MKLYFSPGACSLASHIALEESGLTYTAVKVDLATHKYGEKDYYKINSKGSVPALELDNGEVLTEGSAILQYIGDKAGNSKLVPANGTMERYRLQEWLNYVASEIHKGFSPLWNKKYPEEAKTMFKENLYKRFDYLSEKLTGKKYLMGDQFTVVDTYLFTVLGWTKPLNLDLTKWPVLLGYLEAVKSRPSTVAAMKSEGLLS